MRALVTGGAGFIGSHLTERLLKDGHEVIVLDNLLADSLSNLENVNHNSRLTFVQKDIRDKQTIFSIFEGVDWLFHLAALTSVVASIEQPEDYFDVNVRGTLNILELAKAAKVKRVVYTASASCYGTPSHFPTTEIDPISCLVPYALTKYFGEELVMHWNQVYGLPTIALRLFNVYGPRAPMAGAYASVIATFTEQKKKKLPLTIVGDGEQTRDFVHVEDVVDAFYRAAESSFVGETFNVGSGQEISINELAKLFDSKSVHVAKRPGEARRSLADISKIRKILGWQPAHSIYDFV